MVFTNDGYSNIKIFLSPNYEKRSRYMCITSSLSRYYEIRSRYKKLSRYYEKRSRYNELNIS